MGVNLLKWVILFAVACVDMPESCQSARLSEQDNIQIPNATYIENGSANLIDSLVEMLHFNVADLSEQITHTTIEKKIFTYLSVYLRYNNIRSSENFCSPGMVHRLPFDNPLPKSYYIYTLQKMIV